MATAWLDLAPPETAEGVEIGLTIDGIAVQVDEATWMALCPQYDISSLGASPDESLVHMVEALREAYMFCYAEHRPFPETPTPDEELRNFLVGHAGPQYHRQIRV